MYPCIITEKLMDDWGMVEGEQIEFSEYTDENGNALTVQVVGIFDEINNTDIFWHVEADEFEKEFFVSESSMKDIGSRFSFNEIYYDMYMLLDYSKIHSGNIMRLKQ